MAKYLKITEEFELIWNADWLQACELHQAPLPPRIKDINRTRPITAVNNFENEIYVTVMCDQSGGNHWMVVYTAIDGPIHFKQGTFNNRRTKSVSDYDGDRKQMEAEIDAALGELLSGWTEEYQPKEF